MRSSEPLQNELTWSKSRHEKLAECPRAYFYHYYGSWGGWERGAPPPVRELYVLKKLTSRHAWVGSAVHDSIRRALHVIRDGATPDVPALIELTRQRMRAEFRESRAQLYRRQKAFGLVEHEYEEPVTGDEWRAGWLTVERCLHAFFASRWAARARGIERAHWLPIDELGAFEFEGTRVFAAPDFAFRTPEGGAVIVDWKTGFPRDGDRQQLLGYAMFAQATWGVPLESIEAAVVYLPSAEEKLVAVDRAQVDAFAGRMRASIAAMRERLLDPAANLAAEESFPRTEDPRACARCPFRRPCRGVAVPAGNA
jgi:hypothetical protein